MMKKLFVVFVLSVFFLLNPAYAETFGADGIWTYEVRDGFHICQGTVNKDHYLMLFSEIGSSYSGLSLKVNNKDYLYDEENQNFELLINGKPMGESF